MKAILLSTALLLLSAFSTQAAKSNSSNKFISVKPSVASTQEFGYFRIHRMASDVSLNWSVTDPSAATHFIIERSFDGNWFFTLDAVENDGSATQKYRDTEAFPGYLYYRITVYNADGTSVTSPVEMVRIVSRKG